MWIYTKDLEAARNNRIADATQQMEQAEQKRKFQDESNLQAADSDSEEITPDSENDSEPTWDFGSDNKDISSNKTVAPVPAADLSGNYQDEVSKVRAAVKCDLTAPTGDPIGSGISMVAYYGDWTTEDGNSGKIGLVFFEPENDPNLLKGRLIDMSDPYKFREFSGSLDFGRERVFSNPLTITTVRESGVSEKNCLTVTQKRFLSQGNGENGEFATISYSIVFDLLSDGLVGTTEQSTKFHLKRLSQLEYNDLLLAATKAKMDREQEIKQTIRLAGMRYPGPGAPVLYTGTWQTEDGSESGTLGMKITNVLPGDDVTFSGVLFDPSQPMKERAFEGKLKLGEKDIPFTITTIHDSGVSEENCLTVTQKRFLAQGRTENRKWGGSYDISFNLSPNGLVGTTGMRTQFNLKRISPQSSSGRNSGATEPLRTKIDTSDLLRSSQEMFLSCKNNDQRIALFAAARFFDQYHIQYQDGDTASTIFKRASDYAKDHGKENEWKKTLEHWKKKLTPSEIAKMQRELMTQLGRE